MLTIEVEDSAVRLKLSQMPQRIQERLTVGVTTMVERLRSYIIESKLSGQVLNRRTGDLARSEQTKVESSSSAVVGTVFSSGHASIYGRLHEYGAVFTRRVTMAWGREVKDPKDVTFHYPERSFQRSGLRDKREEIIETLRQSVREGTQ